MKNVVVTGSLAFDHIMDFRESFEENILPDKLKTLSVSFLVDKFDKNFGGVAGNIAYNLGLLNHKAIILSSCGQKDFSPYKKHLQKIGVDINFIKSLRNKYTANFFVITDKNNCQIAAFNPGVMNSDADLNIDSVNKNNPIDFLVISPTIPSAMNSFVNQAKKLNIPYLYDPAQQIPRIEKEELKNAIDTAEILIGNDYEIALIIKKTGFSKKQIIDKVKVLITTLGKEGSIIETRSKQFKIGVVKPKNIIDPTGAGDAYIAGFLKGYLNDHPLDVCGQLGATLGTYAIENYGTQKHKFSLTQFRKRYTENFGKTSESQVL
ncbi:MAG: carbohydrate kinase family protein [Candidatus Levyibacteriota bacterium]